MKKLLAVLVTVFLVSGVVKGVSAEDLKQNEKALWTKEFHDIIPKDKIIGVDQFKKVWEEVLAGKRNAYLIDVRSHSEFYAFHIEGTDHIHAGHVYTIPKKIKDPNAEIYVFCRTQHRGAYVAGFLYKYGYKNVYFYKDGIVGWAKAGLPFVNQFMGKFMITEYHKYFNEDGKYRIREFHPY